MKVGGAGEEGRKRLQTNPSILKTCVRQRTRRLIFPHPLPALLLTPFFAQSLTLVPRSFLLNRTETFATQSRFNYQIEYSPRK